MKISISSSIPLLPTLSHFGMEVFVVTLWCSFRHAREPTADFRISYISALFVAGGSPYPRQYHAWGNLIIFRFETFSLPLPWSGFAVESLSPVHYLSGIFWVSDGNKRLNGVALLSQPSNTTDPSNSSPFRGTFLQDHIIATFHGYSLPPQLTTHPE